MPVYSKWNKNQLPATRPSVWERRERPPFEKQTLLENEASVMEHDPEPSSLCEAEGDLACEVEVLRKQVQELRV